MTNQEWLDKVNGNAAVLRDFVGNWHPSAKSPRREHYMPITAPNTEMACQNVRQSIRQEEPHDPLERWDKAIAAGDVSALINLLGGAWFGVPESTSCWSIPGFKEAVDLLDDTPGEEGLEPPHQTGCVCADCSNAELTADND